MSQDVLYIHLAPFDSENHVLDGLQTDCWCEPTVFWGGTDKESGIPVRILLHETEYFEINVAVITWEEPAPTDNTSSPEFEGPIDDN